MITLQVLYPADDKAVCFLIFRFSFGLAYYGLVLLTPQALGTEEYDSILWSASSEFLGLFIGILLIDHPWGGRRRTQVSWHSLTLILYAVMELKRPGCVVCFF